MHAHNNTATRESLQRNTAYSMANSTSPASPRMQNPPSSARETTNVPRRPARASLMDRSASVAANTRKYASTVSGFAIATC